MLELDWKTLCAIASVAIGIGSFVPYFFDMFAHKTKPHMFTWLIWFVTQGTAAVGVLYGGGGLVGMGLLVATVLIGLVFILSFKYGTKNITRRDVAVLASALLAIVVWWQMHNPVLAVLMVSAIDCLGYVPTYRKLWSEPWSESLNSWVFFSVSYVLAILSLTEYNLLTTPYLAACLVANVSLIAICLVRRPLVLKPVQ